MMLHQTMDAAVREKLIVKNPTNGTIIPKTNYPPKQILSEEQLEKFLAVVKVDPVWSDFFYTELTTGLRRGEICGMRWQDFEEKTGRLHIRRSVSQRKGGVRVDEDQDEVSGKAGKITRGGRAAYPQMLRGDAIRGLDGFLVSELLQARPLRPDGSGVPRQLSGGAVFFRDGKAAAELPMGEEVNSFKRLAIKMNNCHMQNVLSIIPK